jgi:6-phosphofructokinase 1
MASGNVLAIVVGGGPAPGINGVISAATIEARNIGWEVIGFEGGFKGLSRGDLSCRRVLKISDVARIHLHGGSILGTSRTNPTKDPQKMANVARALAECNVTHLITIGGDDTAYTASQIALFPGTPVKTAHVPKTIDNDLPLPPSVTTFGYETARAVGVGVVQNLSEDARTTGRWYFIVAMGRTAGHLALGIGKAAGSTLTIIPEEFGGPEATVSVGTIADILEGAILKRLAMGREFGVALLAEGLAGHIPEADLINYGHFELDEFGHTRLGEINLGQVFRDTITKRLKQRGIEMTIVAKNLGYELRCASPIPFDSEYTRDLGYAAVKFLAQGGSGALICTVGGNLNPIAFDQLLDPHSHRTKVRRVDVTSESYEVARRYMIRLEKSDFERPDQLARLAQIAHTTESALRDQFAYLVYGPDQPS